MNTTRIHAPNPKRAITHTLSRALESTKTLSLGCLMAITAMGCEAPEAPALQDDLTFPTGLAKGDSPTLSSLPANFPMEQDLAILVPMDAEPAIRAGTETRDGGVLMSRRWIDQVDDSYLDTLVLDAMGIENAYEDWQVVSVRIAPCGPLGHFPGHIPEGACWPQVRVVWEPVLKDHMLFGTAHMVDRYADDRAIHALYRVTAHNHDFAPSAALEAVLEQVNAGRPLEEMDHDVLRAFVSERNHAMMRLTQDVGNLRSDETRDTSWFGVGTRTEYNQDAETAAAFQGRLSNFLSDYAQPWALHELTSFSLPEGRRPANINIWTFVAFEGRNGDIIQKDITVQSRENGRLLVNLGKDQTVAAQGEDTPVLDARNDPDVGAELEEHVFFRNSDIREIGETIIDPTKTFVSNTTCATCHRLTDNPFDFHTFSYFEEREATISPRVVADVANDLRILRSFLSTWPR